MHSKPTREVALHDFGSFRRSPSGGAARGVSATAQIGKLQGDIQRSRNVASGKGPDAARIEDNGLRIIQRAPGIPPDADC